VQQGEPQVGSFFCPLFAWRRGLRRSGRFLRCLAPDHLPGEHCAT